MIIDPWALPTAIEFNRYAVDEAGSIKANDSFGNLL